MPSLTAAIEAKYYPNQLNDETELENNGDVQFIIFSPKVDHRKRIQRVLVLDKCEVDSVGDEKFLKDILTHLQELDLSYNHLTQWTDIWNILRCAPCLASLNLSFNNLYCSEFEPKLTRPVVLNQLSVLILIGTQITWKSVHLILSCTANVKDLHLSKNNFNKIDSMDLDGKEMSYPHVTKLMFDENQIDCWDEIQKLGRLFPELVHLGLSDCPILLIQDTAYQYFEKLQSISVSNTLFKNMTDILNFSSFPSLTDLRIQGTLILAESTVHERRQLFIALLPNIRRLNGGAVISNDERDVSERAFIRYFLESEEPKPQRYYDLIAIHGVLQPLVNIELKPKTQVKIRFVFDEIIIEKNIKVYQTVRELKIFLETIIGIQPSRMRLFYIDIGLKEFGSEEMRFPDKQLFSYNLRDGDEVRIFLKGKPINNLAGSTKVGKFEFFETIQE